MIRTIDRVAIKAYTSLIITKKPSRTGKKEKEYMKDTRGYEIKALLKKHYPGAKFSVRLSKYSMGESINIQTDLLKRDLVDHGGYSSYEYSKETIAKMNEIKALVKGYESVDRDQYGEILSGGNTYLFVDPIN